MPTYEYRCPNGHQFEKRQKISDRPAARCPVCGAAAVRQISGGAGLVFKGSGFYITDYGKDGKGPAKRPPESSPAEKSSAEPKPAAKAAPADKPRSSSRGSE